MRWLWAALIVVCAVPACGLSNVSAPALLQVKGVSPIHVSARGGSQVVLSGAGFDGQTRVQIRDVFAHVVSVQPTSLTIEVPTLVAGSASIDVQAGSQRVHLAQGLVVDPVPLNFAVVPTAQLPMVPTPVNALAVLPLNGGTTPEIVAGTGAGLFILRWTSSGTLASTPLPLGSATQPAVKALAVDSSTNLLAACTDDPTTPLQIIDVSMSPPEVLPSAVQQPVACSGVAFVKADPTASRWLIAQTSSGLAVWQPEGTQFAPVTPPALMNAVSALLSANLTGQEQLLVGGTAGSAFWDGLLSLSPTGDMVASPFPVPSSAPLAFATLDANRDGLLDVYAAGSGQDALLIADGHGAFTDQSSLLPFERSTGHGVATGDFDLDGRTDIAIATEDGPDRLFIASDTAFVDQTPLLGLAGPYGSLAIVVADIDGDGAQDVLTGGTFTGGLRLRLLVPPSP